MTETFEIEGMKYTFRYNKRAKDYIRQNFNKSGNKPVSAYVFQYCVERMPPMKEDYEDRIYNLIEKAEEKEFKKEEDQKAAEELTKLINDAVQAEYWSAFPDRIPQVFLNMLEDESMTKRVEEEVKKKLATVGAPESSSNSPSSPEP